MEKFKENQFYVSGKFEVGYQGVPGSFSEQALYDIFNKDVKTTAVESFEDIFIFIQENKILYGILPIENSSTGAISDVYDLLNKYDCHIVAETCLKVNHNLMAHYGVGLQDIDEVYSHPQAFGQCSEFLNEYKIWKTISYQNTAKSAEFVSLTSNKKIAAIGSKRAAEIYNLNILKKDINFNSNNTTRFVVISKNIVENKKNNKISLVFSISHKAGTLYNVLRTFAENELNLLKIESRPTAEKPWEYNFYIDLEGNIGEKRVVEAIDAFEKQCLYFKILGNYEKACDK